MAFQTVFKRYELKYMLTNAMTNEATHGSTTSVTLDENGVAWN